MIVYLNKETREALRNMKVCHPFPFAWVDKTRVGKQRGHVKNQHSHLGHSDAHVRAVAREVGLRKRKRDWKAYTIALLLAAIVYLVLR